MPAIPTILNLNTELYNYLEDVNYGMTKPQFNHLSSIVNDLSIPLQFQPYYSKDICNNLNKSFKSKVGITKDFINDFNIPDNCNSIYCLTTVRKSPIFYKWEM